MFITRSSFFSASLLIFMLAASAQAQPLRVTPLTPAVLERWMVTTTDMKPYAELLEAMHTTEAEAKAKAFEALSAFEQDQQVKDFLTAHKVYDKATAVVKAQGWQSVGDYMRISTQIGNAIAAYLHEDIVASLPADQAQAMRENADPAIAAVSKADLAFIRRNIASIQQFFQIYSATDSPGDSATDAKDLPRI